MPSRDHKRTTVRFTDAEYDRIKEEAQLSRQSIPRLLKASHFRARKLKLLLDGSERGWVCSELRRIGNNVNQIARKVNSGALEGWYSEFSEVTQKGTRRGLSRRERPVIDNPLAPTIMPRKADQPSGRFEQSEKQA